VKRIFADDPTEHVPEFVRLWEQAAKWSPAGRSTRQETGLTRFSGGTLYAQRLLLRFPRPTSVERELAKAIRRRRGGAAACPGRRPE